MQNPTSAAEVAAGLERDIVAGRLGPGERLEPVRALASQLGLAPNTVASAYRTLTERGLVIGQGRRGTFVADRFPVFSPEPTIPDHAVDLAYGNPDPDLLPDLTGILREIEVPSTLYGEESVEPSFESAVRAHLVDAPGDMATVNGALDGIERVLALHLRPGDRVGIENPGWPAMADLVRALLLRPVPIEIDSHGMVTSALASSVESLDAVVITSRVQNPTGACVTASRSTELRSLLDSYPDVLVVEDDHAGLISGSDLAPVGFGRPRWAMAVSMSKAIGPDLRVAALFGDEVTIDGVRQRQRVGPGWVSHLLQVIAASVIADVGAWAGAVTAEYDRRRMLLIDALAGVGIEAEAPSGLNVWVPVTDTAVAVAACLEAGYAIRSGDAFVLDDRRAVRVTTSRMTSEQAEDVARTLGSVLNDERRHIRAG